MPSSSKHATYTEHLVLRMAKVSFIRLSLSRLAHEAKQLSLIFARLLEVDYHALHCQLEPHLYHHPTASRQQRERLRDNISFLDTIVRETHQMKRSARILGACDNINTVSDWLQHKGRFQEAYAWTKLADELREIGWQVLADEEQAARVRSYRTQPVVVSDSEDEGVAKGRL